MLHVDVGNERAEQRRRSRPTSSADRGRHAGDRAPSAKPPSAAAIFDHDELADGQPQIGARELGGGQLAEARLLDRPVEPLRQRCERARRSSAVDCAVVDRRVPPSRSSIARSRPRTPASPKTISRIAACSRRRTPAPRSTWRPSSDAAMSREQRVATACRLLRRRDPRSCVIGSRLAARLEKTVPAAENVRRQVDVGASKLLDELRPDAGRPQPADDLAALDARSARTRRCPA